ncbi:MAG: 4-(cytidine 5'-diphospho)-2-C-methyl-D-erythritol kinase [Solirubrobacteraceae bacterium]
MRELSELAPAKVNVCLYLGPVREDGRHELLSVMQSIDLADRLTLRDGDGPADEVRCPGVEGPNLATAALAAFRAATGWDGPPQLLEIDKRVPVAGGVGGGSADAAAALRLLARRSGRGGDLVQLHEIAARLGADVPSQLQPGRVLARGAGERIRVLPDPNPCGLLVLRSVGGLSTAAVYVEADRLGLPRSAAELEELAALLDTADPEPINDLQPAAISLDPTIELRLAQARDSGASHAFVTGSGPTVIGLFPSYEHARDAAHHLAESGIDAQVSMPWHNPTSP